MLPRLTGRKVRTPKGKDARENEWAVRFKNSATENKPPNPDFVGAVRVKSCGKSARVRMATYVCGKPRLVQVKWTYNINFARKILAVFTLR